MPRYPDIRDGETVMPPKGRMNVACCDCGLVHEMTLRAVRVVSDEPGEPMMVEVIDDPAVQVEFELRRNNRATAQVRRRMRREGEL